ncbi:hypothetical protein PVNG_02393 [Plasmodium vivax North Korean]|uniref:SRP54-type proteins GTP-binding domain-containing protein n=1 Tax=Plasmodium vivax North Korean TaxID=1035514 RepID=A0A0J9TKK1_PLAVI|nr:hypothetical protein PVNG_02393 [Plasmodium vivax North Korean]
MEEFYTFEEELQQTLNQGEELLKNLKIFIKQIKIQQLLKQTVNLLESLNVLIEKYEPTSRAFEYITNFFSTGSSFNLTQLQNNIFELLIKLDFKVELSKLLSEKLINSIQSEENLSQKLIQEKLISELVSFFSSNSENKLSSSTELLQINSNQCSIFFVVGSNGVGKTSFISKLVYYLKEMKNKKEKILLVASDTFRAGAIDQLDILAKKLNVDIQLPKESEKSNSLIYRTLKEKLDKYDLIIFDSSGRQYNNQNLMAELQKQHSLISKFIKRPPEETFLILDSTLGIYSHTELEKLLNSLSITSIVLTKMDNTTRGGVIYNLREKFSIPIKFICFGEKFSDIKEFNILQISSQLIDAIFSNHKILPN